MTTKKSIGVYMDHSSAHLIEFHQGLNESKSILSKFTHQVKEDSLKRSEHVMHNKEQHQQSEYYKKLGEAIRNYDEVLLFGPTTAKLELLNILKADHHFEKINIETKQADKLTEHQQQAFVEDYFLKHISKV